MKITNTPLIQPSGVGNITQPASDKSLHATGNIRMPAVQDSNTRAITELPSEVVLERRVELPTCRQAYARHHDLPAPNHLQNSHQAPQPIQMDFAGLMRVWDFLTKTFNSIKQLLVSVFGTGMNLLMTGLDMALNLTTGGMSGLLKTGGSSISSIVSFAKSLFR